MKIRHLTYFIMLNFINQRAYFQRISYNFNEVLISVHHSFLLSACSDDEPQDSVKEIRMLVSAETGVMYAWGDDKRRIP